MRWLGVRCGRPLRDMACWYSCSSVAAASLTGQARCSLVTGGYLLSRMTFQRFRQTVAQRTDADVLRRALAVVALQGALGQPHRVLDHAQVLAGQYGCRV